MLLYEYTCILCGRVRATREHACLPIDGLLALATDPTSPVPVLTALADRRCPQVNVALAAHPSTPGSLLAVLASKATPASDDDPALADYRRALRRTLAANPHLPGTVMSALAVDPDPGTRMALAANPASPPSVLAVLLVDPDGTVRGSAYLHTCVRYGDRPEDWGPDLWDAHLRSSWGRFAAPYPTT